MVLGSVGGQKNRCKSRMPSQELNKATWLRPHPLFSPRFTCLPTKNPCLPICRTEQPNEAADSEERPAKRIQVEHCSSEEVSKVANPFLIWKSTNSRKIGFTRGSLVVDGYPHFLEIYFVLQYIIILYYTKYRLYRTHSFTQKNIAAMAPARKTLQINNLCELILGGESGDYLYLQSRGRSQFLDKREMPLVKL